MTQTWVGLFFPVAALAAVVVVAITHLIAGRRGEEPDE